ncbi:MAG: hypothetical protein II967_02010, partial [Deltaproteobacteria bacterium]|nr:hypothetical protein [Deltaproteobacteria bacterium]
SQGLDTESGRELLRLRGHNILLREERDALKKQTCELGARVDALRNETESLLRQKDTLYREKETLSQERNALREERDVLREERNALHEERDTLRGILNNLLSSKSWRVTAPLRYVRHVMGRVFRWGGAKLSRTKAPTADNITSDIFKTEVSAGNEAPDSMLSGGTVCSDTLPVHAALSEKSAEGEEFSGETVSHAGVTGKESLDTRPVDRELAHESGAAEAAARVIGPSALALEALCWKGGYPLRSLLEGKGPRVSIWVAKQGNYFFHDIARLLYSGFQEMGVEATLNIVGSENECLNPVNLDIPLRIVVAPHEFFLFVPEAAAWPLNGERLWRVNTEQIRLGWFVEGARHFGKADLILDFDQGNVRHFLENGLPAQYLPLGFSGFCPGFDGTAAIPLSIATEGLPKTTREWQVNEEPLSEPLSARPLDCCFFGAATPRRSEFFARNAALFADFHSYLRLQDMSCPLVSGETTPLDTASASSIVRRSKFSLNLHQSDMLYFEWHRIVLLGMWQGAVVISEPCSASWPLQPGRDYIAAGLADMPVVIEYLLRSSAGMEKAEEVRRNALKTLRKYSMDVILKGIMKEHALIMGESGHA